MAAERADAALVARGLAASLQEARLMIMEGRAYLGGGKISKPSDRVKPGLCLTVRGEKREYVSRGGHKLKRALDVFGIDLAGRVCVDVGASTGGFTDVMLRAGAGRVYAVDVGYGQLDYSLRSDPRVVVMERTNARFLRRDAFDPLPSFGATDVSFISLRAVLPASLALLEGEKKRFVALVKPQFEAERDKVGAKGVVRDRNVHEEVLRGIAGFVREIGWTPRGLEFSPITGPEGNIEFLLDIDQDARETGSLTQSRIDEVISRAYDKFVNSGSETCI